MAARSNALLSAIASAVRLNPRLSAGLAFEIGVMVGTFVRSARGRKGIAGATAKLIDAVPLMPHSQPAAPQHARRKAAGAQSAPRANAQGCA